MPADGPSLASLEIRGPQVGLLDDPLGLRVRGAGPEATIAWRARLRDDEDRVWKASAGDAEALSLGWERAASDAAHGRIAALESLRPVSIDVRAEAPDGRAATRTLIRLLKADGVRLRRWRDGLDATLHLPAASAPKATLLVDATGGTVAVAVAALAAPLLASRGVLVLVVGPARRRRGAKGIGDPVAVARERLSTVPGAGADAVVLPALEPHAARIASGEIPPAREIPPPGGAPAPGVVLPPGVPVHDETCGAASSRADAWDALLAELGAEPRRRRYPDQVVARTMIHEEM